MYAPFGDSLSVGLFADSKTSRFTTLFADQLHRLTDKTVTEEGIAEVGKTATNLGVPALPALIAQHPDLITIEFGTNDAVGGATPTALADYRQALTTIVATLQKQTTAELILMTTWSPNHGPYAAADLQFDAVVKQIGQTYHVPVADLATIWQNHDDITGPAVQPSPTSLVTVRAILFTLTSAVMIRLLPCSRKLWRNNLCKMF